MKLLIKSAVKNFIIFSTALYTSISLAQNKLAIVIDDVGYHLKEDAAIFPATDFPIVRLSKKNKCFS